jgi:hypothetical protein
MIGLDGSGRRGLLSLIGVGEVMDAARPGARDLHLY